MLLYESEHLRLRYAKPDNLFQCDWLSFAGRCDHDYKAEILRLSEYIGTHSPATVLFDMARFDFILVPELQVWQRTHILPNWQEQGVKHIGIVHLNDFFIRLSIEQTLSSFFCLNFLSDMRSAKQWIKRL